MSAGASGKVHARRATWIVPVLLSFAVVLSGCHESPAARKNAKEKRWRKGRAFAELRILKERRPILPGSKIEPEENFETYRQTQARIITSPFVLQGAMRRPEIPTLSVLKEQPHPLEWLERNLEITFPAEEFIRVSIKSDEPGDSAAIVNAVVKVYLDECAEKEGSDRRSRITQLERAREELLNVSRTKKARFQRIAEEIGATNETTLSHAELAMVEFYGLVRSELAREEFARARDHMDLKIMKEHYAGPSGGSNGDSGETGKPSSIDEAEFHRMEASIRDREIRIADWKRMLEKQLRDRKTTAVHSMELETLQHELQKDQEILDEINDEITRAELEREPEPRITLFRKAETPHGD